MYFKNIETEKFLAVHDVYNINSILSYKFHEDAINSFFKIKLFQINEFEKIGDYTISSKDILTNVKTKYPDNCKIKLKLEQGNYRISCVSGSILNKDTGNINDCINSSKGEIKFNELGKNNKTSIKYFDIEVKSKSKLYIWISNENISGSLTFEIHKISLNDDVYKLEVDEIFHSSNIPSLNCIKNKLYNIELYKYEDEEKLIPTFKYPAGTYQIIINDIVKTSFDLHELDQYMYKDLTKFDIDNFKKIQNFDNIVIPSELDPVNYYIMLGKIEVELLIDFENDQFYFYPNSYLECFMNLYVPNSYITTIESNERYVRFKIVDYKLISYDFNDKESIITGLTKWVDIEKSNIKSDEYELYFYAKNYNLYEDYYSKISKFIDIDSYFSFIEIKPTALLHDDVSNIINNENTILEFIIKNCDWKVIDSSDKINNKPVSSNFNFISWNDPENWNNDIDENGNKILNKLKTTISGIGVKKISKRHFYNITGVNIDYVKEGNITHDQFLKLNLNTPIVSPYDRFQYWLSIKV